MLQTKAIARFAVIATVVYLALAVPSRVSTTWQANSARAFHFAGDAFFSQFWFWPEAHVRFFDARSTSLIDDINRAMPGELPAGLNPPKPSGEQDTLLLLLNARSPGEIGMLLTSSGLMAYAPLTLMAALILATPMRWLRKGWALLWSLLLTQAFVFVRLTALLLHHGYAAAGKKYALFEPGSLFSGGLRRADEVLADNPTFAFVAPVCIWLLVILVFARRDRKQLGHFGVLEKVLRTKGKAPTP